MANLHEIVDEVGRVYLSDFIDLVRSNVTSSRNAQEIANALVSAGVEWDTLVLNETLSGDEVEDAVFAALGTCAEVDGLLVFQTVDASSITQVLRRAVQALTGLTWLYLSDIGISTLEAEEICTALQQTAGTRQPFHVIFKLNLYSDGVMNAFARFIRESPMLEALSLHTRHRISDGMTEAAFHSLCQALSASPSVLLLDLGVFPDENSNVQRCANMLANAMVNSTTFTTLQLHQDPPGPFTMDRVERALLRSNAVKTFDVCFRKEYGEDEEYQALILSRSTPWKLLLGDDNVPLQYWPKILAKANTWNMEASQSSLDALFFLMKEKNDVLLQNVKKRKIRKRKRFQFT